MAEYSAPATLTTPAGTVVFNADIGDTYQHDPTACAGLDMAPLRTPIDDAPQTDGGLVHSFFFGARHVTLSGTLLVRTGSSETDVVWVRNQLEDILNAALASIIRVDGTYSFTPTGMAPKTLTVRCDVPAAYSGAMLKTYIFGLVAADPAFA